MLWWCGNITVLYYDYAFDLFISTIFILCYTIAYIHHTSVVLVYYCGIVHTIIQNSGPYPRVHAYFWNMGVLGYDSLIVGLIILSVVKNYYQDWVRNKTWNNITINIKQFLDFAGQKYIFVQSQPSEVIICNS